MKTLVLIIFLTFTPCAYSQQPQKQVASVKQIVINKPVHHRHRFLRTLWWPVKMGMTVGAWLVLDEGKNHY